MPSTAVSHQMSQPFVRRPFQLGAMLLAFAGLTFLPPESRALDRPASVPASLGRNQSAAGLLLRFDRSRQSWRPVRPGGAVGASDRLLALPGARAEIEMNAGLRLTLWGNTPDLADVPLLETVVRLDSPPQGDLALTLERGRIILTNRRGKEAPRVRVAFLNQAYEIRLTDPDAEVVVSLYSRWPPGVPFTRQPTEQDAPTAVLGVFVLKGDANLKVGSNEFLLRPPPGPASFRWDTIRGADVGPRRRASVPLWAQPEAHGNEMREVQASLERLGRSLASRPPAAVLAEGRDDADATPRRLAVYAMGAMDDTGGLIDSLSDPRHADVRDAAVEALRQWIGRAPGQDGKLFQLLVQRRKYTESQAETVLQLLHSFGPDERARPDTYETLIAYLRSSRLPIRALAWWHLARWVPSAVHEAPFDPAGSEDDRDRAVRVWRRLLKEGKLAPRRPAGEGK